MQAAALPPPRILNAGEAAFVVEFGDGISAELNARATGLAALLEREPFDGYREAIPTYRSLLVFHEPACDPETVRQHTLRLGGRMLGEPETPPRRIEIPCVYDGEDLPEVAAAVGVSERELVRIHCGRTYRVFIVGFTPGFPYLGMADPRLDLPRRAVPRVRVPAGSVAMARAQTGIYPWVTPGGWHLLGRTDPALLFDLSRSPPSLCLPGDQVRFVPVTKLPSRPGTNAHPGPGADPAAGAEAAVEVERGGLLTTVQDLGRRGHQRYGVPLSGAADPDALVIANTLVGNPRSAAGLECILPGPVLRFRRPVLCSLAGADHRAVLHTPRRPAWPVPVGLSFLAAAGSVLRFSGPPAGMRAYLAFAGGIAVPRVLGSRSTYLTAGFGGFRGRALRSGDILPLGRPTAAARESRYLREARRDPDAGGLRLRLSLGPQEHCFTRRCLSGLESRRWRISNDSNRMGVRLDGPLLEHRPGRKEIVSDANPSGTVQVPPGGHPIVMGADQGTTGGYPKIGSVVGPDLARLAQAAPGTEVRFEVIPLAEARRVTLSEAARIEAAGRV